MEGIPHGTTATPTEPDLNLESYLKRKKRRLNGEKKEPEIDPGINWDQADLSPTLAHRESLGQKTKAVSSKSKLTYEELVSKILKARENLRSGKEEDQDTVQELSKILKGVPGWPFFSNVFQTSATRGEGMVKRDFRVFL